MRILLLVLLLSGCVGGNSRVIGSGPLIYDPYLAEYCMKFPDNIECGGTK